MMLPFGKRRCERLKSEKGNPSRFTMEENFEGRLNEIMQRYTAGSTASRAGLRRTDVTTRSRRTASQTIAPGAPGEYPQEWAAFPRESGAIRTAAGTSRNSLTASIPGTSRQNRRLRPASARFSKYVRTAAASENEDSRPGDGKCPPSRPSPRNSKSAPEHCGSGAFSACSCAVRSGCR